MKRRKFVTSSAALGAVSISARESILMDTNAKTSKELYELRTYELTFGGNRKSLLTYLQNVLHPALWEAGCNHTFIFKEVGDPEPTKIWTLISYPSMETYLNSFSMNADEEFVDAAKDYAAAGKAFNRYTSSLLSAFNGLPQMMSPKAEKNLFEIRLYEGVNEDAVRRKINMFNDEEIELFYEVGLTPVFFGDMKIGPIMPCLVYMLAFDDMNDRNESWGKFINHPEWNRMKALPKYANTVSNIRKIFLEKL